MNQPDPAEIEAIAAKRCVDCGLHPIVDETGLCIECIEANTATLLAALATAEEERGEAVRTLRRIKANNTRVPGYSIAAGFLQKLDRAANYHKATGPQAAPETENA